MPLLFIYSLSIVKCLQRQHAWGNLWQHDAAHYYIYDSFIYYLVPAAAANAACVRHPAAAWRRPLLIIYLFIIYLLLRISLIIIIVKHAYAGTTEQFAHLRALLVLHDRGNIWPDLASVADGRSLPTLGWSTGTRRSGSARWATAGDEASMGQACK
jgi:hypothetical protein